MANTTWNPSDKTANLTLTGGNLIATSSAGASAVRAIDKQIAGKFYWEVTCNTFTSNSSTAGAARPTADLTLTNGVSLVGGGMCGVQKTGNIFVDGVGGGSLGAIVSGNIVCIAIDCDARLIWFRLGAAGNWNGSATANPATGVGGNAMPLGIGVPLYPAAWLANTNEQVTANFGGSAFTGAVPAGFTSGFTAGVTSPTNAISTQATLEQFLYTNPPAQVTQVALEHWVTTATVFGQAIVTQVVLEEWAKVTPPIPPVKPYAMILT
jgi:hypothetical protein